MKKIHALLATSFALACSFTAEAASYQATGPILEVNDTKIVIAKGKEKWEIARTAETKVMGDLKVGSKVTIFYTMTAVSVDAKPEKPAPSPASTKTAPKK